MRKIASGVGVVLLGALGAAATFGGCTSSDTGPSAGGDAGLTVLEDSSTASPDATLTDAGPLEDGRATTQDSGPSTDSSAGPDSGGTDSGTDAGDDAGEDAGDAGPCVHSACVPGAKLDPSCDFARVCSGGAIADPYCCTQAWDRVCVVEQGLNCAGAVDAGYTGFGGTEQTVAQVAVSDETICAVTTSGDLYCWGDDSQGEIGDGRYAGFTNFPRKVASSISVVAPQDYGACAVGTDQAMHCWGHFDSLNDGGVTLTPPSTAQLAGVVSIASAFRNGAFSLNCAVTSGGGTYCWQRGDKAPSLVDLSDAGLGDTATKVFTGGGNACALVAGGKPICWGDNLEGELGDQGAGGSTGITCIPSKQPDAGVKDCTIPESGVVKMAIATSNSVCMLDGSGAVRCLGDNGNGELAQGTTAGAFSYPLVANLPPMRDLAAGEDFFCAAPVDMTQPVRCWGSTYESLLGPNTPDAGGAGTPVTVPGLTGVVSLGGSWQNMCAVKQDGSLWCWGNDGYGQLANVGPYLAPYPTPVRIPILSFP